MFTACYMDSWLPLLNIGYQSHDAAFTNTQSGINFNEHISKVLECFSMAKLSFCIYLSMLTKCGFSNTYKRQNSSPDNV